MSQKINYVKNKKKLTQDNWNFKNDELKDKNEEMQKFLEQYNSNLTAQRSENLKPLTRGNTDHLDTPKKSRRKYSGYTDSQMLGCPNDSQFSDSELNFSEIPNPSLYSKSRIDQRFKKNQIAESKTDFFGETEK